MKPITGIDLQEAAKYFHISAHQLREHLKSIGAIEKTDFGLAATDRYRKRGLMRTQARETMIFSVTGEPIKRTYTVAQVTGNGLPWLQKEVDKMTQVTP